MSASQEEISKQIAKQGEFKKENIPSLLTKNDQELVLWQSDFEPQTPQYKFVEYELQRRISESQIKATHLATKNAAIIGVIGGIVGTIIGAVASHFLK
jgi:uncharacterized membrane protein